MNISINCNIQEKLNKDEIKININAGKNSEELQNIISKIQEISKQKDNIIGYNNNELFILPIDKIILFYTNEQKCYCKIENKQYQIKKRMYELEEILNKNQFIRISNSCIINIQQIVSFDLKYIGNIKVKLKNGDNLDVSQRRVGKILKYLKERWE